MGSITASCVIPKHWKQPNFFLLFLIWCVCGGGVFMYMCLCVHIYVNRYTWAYVYVHVETRDQCLMSYFMSLYLIFWNKCFPLNVEHNLASPRDPPVSDSQLCTMPNFLCECWEIWPKVLMFTWQALYPLSYMSNTQVLTSKWKKTLWKSYMMYCMIPMIWLCEKVKIVEILKSSVIARDKVEHERLLVLWVMLYYIVIVGTCN